MKDFLSKVIPVSLSFGIYYTMSIIIRDFKTIRLGDYDTPKVIRDGNLSMFKSIIISNYLLRGLLIIFISILLIKVLTLLFKNIEINSIVKVSSIIGSVFMIFIGFYHFKNIPYTENDVYYTIESKAENFITDFTNKEYDKMVTNYVLNSNMNEFISKYLYSQAMNRTIREYGQIREIEDPIKINIGVYTILSYPVIHEDDQVVYYNIAFNSKNEISSLFTTLSLLG